VRPVVARTPTTLSGMADPADTSPGGPPADPAPGDSPQLSPEDAKLVTLARATRARTGAAEGAAVRDADGRTYAAATVELPSLRLSAMQVCVAMAVASGSRGLEAAVVLTEADDLAAPDRSAVADLGGERVALFRGDVRGALVVRA
jgi:hypothetical protein